MAGVDNQNTNPNTTADTAEATANEDGRTMNDSTADEALLLADRVVLIGGTPGRLVGDWNIQLPEPRADSVRALAQLRLSIVEALHQARKPPVVAASESLIYEI